MKKISKILVFLMLISLFSGGLFGCTVHAEEIPETEEVEAVAEEIIETDEETVIAEPVEVKEPIVEIVPAVFDGELPVQLTVTDIDNIMFLESLFGSEKNSNSVISSNSLMLPEYSIVEVDSAENILGGEIEEVYAYKIQDADGNDIVMDLLVYPVYDVENDELLREYATYCEITEDGVVVNKGFFPIVIEEYTLKIVSNEIIEFPELALDENGALVIPNIYQNQDSEEVEAELLNALRKHNKNNPELYEDTDENKIPDNQIVYCDGVGNIINKPIYPINDDAIIRELLEAKQEKIDEDKENGYVTIEENVEQPVENDNYNSPVCVIIEVEPIIIPVVITAELNEDGNLVFADGEVVSLEPDEAEENNNQKNSESNAASEQKNSNSTTQTNQSSNDQTVPATETPVQNTSVSEPEEQPNVPEQSVDTTPKGHYEQVWVVDVPTKVVEEPVYETQVMYICNGCGYSTASAEDIGQHEVVHNLTDGTGYRYHSESVQVQTGTKKTTIPEQGHYEQKWVLD